ncbi:hypothetical protein BsWGS_14298 [Bradybaena similaris]
MTTIKTFRHFYLILLPYINLPMNSAEVQVALEMMTPILNTKFYVLCDIKVSTSKEDEVFLDQQVLIEDKNLKCKITDWKFCNKVPPDPKPHGSCGCSSKKAEIDGYKYQFYLYLNPVSESFMSSQFTCQLHTKKDTRQLDVITFTKQPERTLYKCKNTRVQFNWEFSPIRGIIISRFNVTKISWTSLDRTGQKRYLGSYHFKRDEYCSFRPDGYDKSSVNCEKGKLPKMILSNLMLQDSEQYITITVTFNLAQMKGHVKRFIPTNTEFPNFDSKNVTDKGGEGTTLNSTDITSAGVNTTQKNTNTKEMTTTTTARRTQPTTTTPIPVETPLEDPDNHMTDTVQLIVTEPPSNETRAKVNAYESLTGNLVITCTIQYMKYHRQPPVNVSIWRDDKLLITRSGITVLHYSTVKEGKLISCGLEGHALDCLGKRDPRSQRVTFDLKDLKKSEKPTGGVDLLLSLYAWESIICIVLMLWVISLLLDHIRLVVRKARRELESANKALLKSEMARPIVLARIRSH